MCGIYGMIGNINPKHEKKAKDIFIALGELSEERGIHATGFYAMSGELVTHDKSPVKASIFFKENQAFNSMPFPSILIGHNRWASHGDPSDNRNNHPFTTSRFGFIHNGIVGNVDVAGENLKSQSECDSELFFRYFVREFHNYGGEGHNLHSKGFTILEKTMKRFDSGDFACALVDSKNRYLYLFRNAGRPLWVTTLPWMGCLIFASTKKILSDALNLYGVSTPEKSMRFLDRGLIMRIDEKLNIKTFKVKLRDPKPTFDVYSNYINQYALNKPDSKKKNLYSNSATLSSQINIFDKDNKTPVVSYENDHYDRTVQAKKGSGNWICSICHKAFVTAYLCKTHVHFHHGVKNEDCPVHIYHKNHPAMLVDFSTNPHGEVVFLGTKIPAVEVV